MSTPPIDVSSPMHAVLADVGDPVEIIDVSLKSGFAGELYFVGDGFRSKVCLYEGKMAWVYCSTHHEHLGNVLERDAELEGSLLANAMLQAKRQHRKLGEWLVDQGLVTMPQLRRCLKNHLGAHLRALALTTGDFELAFVEYAHRYDHALTFDLDEIVSGSVLDRTRDLLSVADGLFVVDSVQRRVVGSECSQRAPVGQCLAELAVRVARFASAVGISEGPTVATTDAGLLCVIPLQLHPRLCLGIALRDHSKIGLVLKKAIRIQGTI